MIISRNEALRLLDECRLISKTDPESAREMAIGVLLDIVDDEHIRFSFKMVIPIHSDPLEFIPKLLA